MADGNVRVIETAEMFAMGERVIRWLETWLFPDGEPTCFRCGPLQYDTRA